MFKTTNQLINQSIKQIKNNNKLSIQIFTVDRHSLPSHPKPSRTDNKYKCRHRQLSENDKNQRQLKLALRL
jgi:hypothetical protein